MIGQSGIRKWVFKSDWSLRDRSIRDVDMAMWVVKSDWSIENVEMATFLTELLRLYFQLLLPLLLLLQLVVKKQVPRGYNDASSSGGRTDGRTDLLGRFKTLSF